MEEVLLIKCPMRVRPVRSILNNVDKICFVLSYLCVFGAFSKQLIPVLQYVQLLLRPPMKVVCMRRVVVQERVKVSP